MEGDRASPRHPSVYLLAFSHQRARRVCPPFNVKLKVLLSSPRFPQRASGCLYTEGCLQGELMVLR